MTVRPRPLFVCGIVPTLLVAALSLARPSVFASLEYSVYDTVLRASGTVPPGERVVIVDVDERSLTTIGQWPWRRDLIGDLVDRLRDLDAGVIALDIIFAEPDRYEGPSVDPDRVLASSLRKGRVVLGYGMRFEPAQESDSPCVQHPLGLVMLGRDDESGGPPFFPAKSATCSLSMLTAAAGASGFLNAAPDSDGLLRRAPLLIELAGHVYPALGVAAVSAITGQRDVALRVANVNSSALVLSGRGAATTVPLDGKSNLLLRFRGPKDTFPYISAADVLHNKVARGKVAGKLVLVGTTALGTREVVSTPLDTQFTGVEVQATIADNLLQRDFVHRPEYGVSVETLLLIALGFAVSLMAARLSIGWAAVTVAGGLSATWSGAISIFSTNGAFYSPLFPTIGLACTLTGVTVAGLTIERRRAEKAGKEREASRRLMIQTLLSLTEIKDAETGKHSRRTQMYTRVIAQELATYSGYREYLTRERIDLLATLAPLHDIGKVGVPDAILNKPGRLTPEELVEMRRHPVHGRDVIVNAQRDAGVRDDVTLGIAKDIVYTHHEKWDGSGYPEGLKEHAIPIPGRIMAVVDVYDASTTRKLYMPSLSADEAVALILRGRGTHFDPAVVDAFLKVVPILRSLGENEQAA
jgi:adenylate cyclase